MMDAPKVTIIVLHYRHYGRTRQCLLSLNDLDYPNFETLVIDNGSRDGALEKLQNEFPHTRMLTLGSNRGFAGGVNVGIRVALAENSDCVMLLNNDAKLTPDVLSKLVAAQQKDPSIGIISPKFLHDQERSRLAGIGFRVLTYDVKPVGWNEVDGESDHVSGTANSFSSVNSVVFFDAVSGCAMLIKREVFVKTGLFDERFFFYFEDTDFCQRTRAAGFKVAYLPSAVVYHCVSASTQDTPGLSDYYLGRSRQIYFRKHLKGFQKLVYAMLEPIHVLRTARIKLMKEGDSMAALSYTKGAIAGWLVRSPAVIRAGD